MQHKDDVVMDKDTYEKRKKTQYEGEMIV